MQKHCLQPYPDSNEIENWLQEVLVIVLSVLKILLYIWFPTHASECMRTNWTNKPPLSFSVLVVSLQHDDCIETKHARNYLLWAVIATLFLKKLLFHSSLRNFKYQERLSLSKISRFPCLEKTAFYFNIVQRYYTTFCRPIWTETHSNYFKGQSSSIFK